MNTLTILTNVAYGLLSLILSFVICTLIEWCLHAKLLHGAEGTLAHAHHAGHHEKNALAAYKSTGHEDDGFGLAPPVFAIVVSVMLALGGIAAHLLHHLVIFLTVLVSAPGYFLGLAFIHRRVHVPKTGGFFEKTRLYRHLDRHHRVHHARGDRNFCIVAPLIADYLMRTLHRPTRQEEPAL
jgi:hypothetical protein